MHHLCLSTFKNMGLKDTIHLKKKDLKNNFKYKQNLNTSTLLLCHSLNLSGILCYDCENRFTLLER
jgi:hypothetical protein